MSDRPATAAGRRRQWTPSGCSRRTNASTAMTRRWSVGAPGMSSLRSRLCRGSGRRDAGPRARAGILGADRRGIAAGDAELLEDRPILGLLRLVVGDAHRHTVTGSGVDRIRDRASDVLEIEPEVVDADVDGARGLLDEAGEHIGDVLGLRCDAVLVRLVLERLGLDADVALRQEVRPDRTDRGRLHERHRSPPLEDATTRQHRPPLIGRTETLRTHSARRRRKPDRGERLP
jgi:hypothetical protein